MTDEELIKRLRGGDVMNGMTVDCKRDRCNCATMGEAADRIEALLRDLKSARIRIEIVQAVCLGLSEQLMKAHTEIAQTLGKAGGEG